MPRSCEVRYRGFDSQGDRLPRLTSYGTKPIDVSKTPLIGPYLALGLAMAVAYPNLIGDYVKRIPTMRERIYSKVDSWVSEKPDQKELRLALLVAGGTLILGAAATVYTYLIYPLPANK